MLAETFVELLKNPGHWEFEIFGMIIFDGLLAGLAFPFFKRWLKDHDEKKHPKCDHEEETLEAQVAALKRKVEALEWAQGEG